MPVMTEEELKEARKRINAGVKLRAGIVGTGIIVILGILLMATPPGMQPLFLVLALASLAALTLPLMLSLRKKKCGEGP